MTLRSLFARVIAARSISSAASGFRPTDRLVTIRKIGNFLVARPLVKHHPRLNRRMQI
jgi:hypothetical protein